MNMTWRKWLREQLKKRSMTVPQLSLATRGMVSQNAIYKYIETDVRPAAAQRYVIEQTLGATFDPKEG